MEFRNDTPFAPMVFESLDEQDRPIHVAILRGTFDVVGDELRPSADQQPVAMADQYFGAPLESSIRIDTDLVPKKYHADITLEAVAHAPDGHAAESWEVGVAVGVVSKRLRVTGPRHWNSGRDEWVLSRPEPTREVPIRYEQAFGGRYRRDDREVGYEENPIGRGFADLELWPRDEPLPAPQIEHFDDPIRQPDRAYRPAGFGPVPKHCLPRRALCGTPDDRWKAERWPLRPRDFDFHYYNCASPGLHYDGYLSGAEYVHLWGLSPFGEVVFQLPARRNAVFALDRQSRIRVESMVLDTLHIDTVQMKAYLTWRWTGAKTAPLATLQLTTE